MFLVLSELQRVIEKRHIEKLMVCLSFATRLNLETLRKGQIEGAALQFIHTILTRIVNRPNQGSFRLTTLMEKYVKSYKLALPICVLLSL